MRGTSRSVPNGNRAAAKRSSTAAATRVPRRPPSRFTIAATSSRSAASAAIAWSFSTAARSSRIVFCWTATRIRRTIMSPQCAGSPRASRSSASRSSSISARTGGSFGKRSSRWRSRDEPVGGEARIARQVAEAHDQLDARLVVRVAEREVPHPRAVGRDLLADRPRQHKRTDRRRREHGLREDLRRRRARGVRELVCAGARVVLDARHVGRADDELDRRRRELARHLDQLPDPLVDRLGQPVVVRAEERQPPERVRPEHVVRLQAEHELLEIVEPVERGHHAAERAGGCAVDPADARPDRALAQALQEAELQQHAVDGAAGEDERDVGFHPTHGT